MVRLASALREHGDEVRILSILETEAVAEQLCTMTTTNSRLAADSLVRRGIVRRDRLVVIPNALDPAPFLEAGERRSAIREALGVSAREFVCLAAGRLEPQKDYPTLLAAL